MTEKQCKVGLGTVQLGMPYGNASNYPLMSEADAIDILHAAAFAGIEFFDTAMAYGESEARVGRAKLGTFNPDVSLSTKIPVVPAELWRSEGSYWRYLVSAITHSCQILGVDKLGLLQFHQCSLDFLSHSTVRKCLDRLVSDGLCDSVGVSVYEPEEALAALEIPIVSSLQIPLNLIDHRFITADLLNKYSKRGVFLIIRSMLMQGLLVESAKLPEVKRMKCLLELRQRLIRSAGDCSLQALAFRFIFGNMRNKIDVALIGVDSILSLRENLKLIELSTQPVSAEILGVLEPVRTYAIESGILSPAHWNK